MIQRFTLLFFTGIFLCGLNSLQAQSLPQAPKTNTTSAADSSRLIEILPGVRKLEMLKTDDSTELTILAGNVKLKQGPTYIDCDSCVINNRTKIFEAFGRVHINDSDTAHVYSDYLRYFQDKRFAFLKGNVKLTDGKGVLTTPELEYDVNTKIGIYKKGGKVVNKKTIITSQEGHYYADLKDVYFKKDVDLKDPAYSIKTDSLLINTETQLARFIAYTFIKDSSGRTIETSDGYYDLKKGKAEFGGRPKIVDGKTKVIADSIAFDDSTGISQFKGNVVIIDTVEKNTIIAGEVFRNNKMETILATRKPLMIIMQDNDSIFISADTLFSARLTDLYAKQDSLEKEKKKAAAAAKISTQNKSDSTNKNRMPVKDSSGLEDKPVQVIDSTLRRDSVITDTVQQIKPPIIVHVDSVVKKDTIQQIKRPDLIRTDSLIKKDTSGTERITGVKVINLNKKDSTGKKDSTNRYFEAYRNVRIFSDSLQAVSDSMFYSFKDSTFRLFYDPIVWSKEKNQITGDTIYLFTKNKKADRLKVINNSFFVNEVQPGVYNQIKSNRMDGYFINGDIDSLRAKGMAECIYYLQDEDSAYTGINESKSDIIDIYFREKELHKVALRNAVTATIWPIRQKRPGEMRLPSFQWLDSRRPKSKTELFE